MTEDQTIRKRRRVNGEGSVYKRQDGYWVGAFDVPTTSGARRRVVVYGKTLAEAREKLSNVQQTVRSGIPVPAKCGSWGLTWSTGWRISSSATGARAPTTCTR